MKLIVSTALTAILSAGALVAGAGSASAAVVCNENGDCWHVDNRAHYGRDVRLERHSDDWYFHQKWDQDNRRHWREYHEGRGYYLNGQWVPR